MMEIGDFVFFEFKLVQIKEVTEDGRVTDVSDGYFSIVSSDLSSRILPITLTNKIVSEEYMDQSKYLHKYGNPGLNYPDIHRHLVGMWLEDCNALSAGEKAPNDVRGFVKKVLDSYKKIEVDGVILLRPPTNSL